MRRSKISTGEAGHMLEVLCLQLLYVVGNPGWRIEKQKPLGFHIGGWTGARQQSCLPHREAAGGVSGLANWPRQYPASRLPAAPGRGAWP